MYNLLIAGGLSLISGTLVSLMFDPFASVVPAALVFILSAFLLMRRTGQQVEQALAPVSVALQAGKIADAEAAIRDVQRRFGRWQLLLANQMESQLGIIQYLQMKWDKALPMLQAGSWRNWLALLCIGAIHYRRNNKDSAWEYFKKASDSSPKEVLIYLVWATLLTRDGKRPQALDALSVGLEHQPDSEMLRNLKQRIANKKRIDVKRFPDSWYQIFPEDLAQQQLMRGRRGGPGPQQLVALPQPKTRGKQGRRR